MLTLQMLPATCGDCLWLEYGTGAAKRVVIIDGGLTETATALRKTDRKSTPERGVATLDVELLVVTHIDNDHILGVIELLKAESPGLRVKDIWFNGRPQLMALPASARDRSGGKRRTPSSAPADLMGGPNGADEDRADLDATVLPSAADLLGPQQGDQLSELLAKRRLPWNKHAPWNGGAVMIPDTGELPSVTLDGDLTLTLLGPNRDRLYKLCAAWTDVLGGIDEPAGGPAPDDLLGRRDAWPPAWKDGESRDPSVANGSSIVLLAEHRGQALLLAGDGHAPDMAAALDRLRAQRRLQNALPLAAFKLSHHASENNLTRELLEKIDCQRFLVSTDGSVHRHPDHLALLRILRYATRRPEFLFNYRSDTTRPWDQRKRDVTRNFQDYDTRFPDDPAEGIVVSFD